MQASLARLVAKFLKYLNFYMERESSSETLAYAYICLPYHIAQHTRRQYLQSHLPPRKSQIPKHAFTSILQEPYLQYV